MSRAGRRECGRRQSAGRRGGRAEPAERRLWREDAPAGRTLACAVALDATAAACWLVFAVLLAMVVGRVFLRGATFAAQAAPLTAMLVLVLLRGGLLWAGEVRAQAAAESLKGRLRERLAASMVALGPTYTCGARTGELVYVAGEAVEALDAYVTRYRPARQLAVIVPLLTAAVVLAVDPWTVLVLLFAGPVIVLLLALIGVRVRDLTDRRERELAWMNAHFLDVLRGLPTLKAFGRTADAAGTIERVSRGYASATMDVLRTAFQTSLVLEWGATAATALVAIEASVRLMSGGLPFERALAVLLLAPEFFLPLRRLSLEYHAGRTGTAAAARVHALLDRPAVPQAPGPLTRPLPSRNDLAFDGVRVAYDGGTRPALDGFSLEVAEGQKAALLGPTGAGKTTVANVLLRFVEPGVGSVTVGGAPLRELDPARWRARVGLVPQHPFLFLGTVADNIRLARPEASQEEVVEAARAAHAHEFVSALPRGYATTVGENGSRLSGGERQRLAIARAFLKDAPLVILDEATSHLDEESEALVVDALGRLLEGRTALLITHRPRLLSGVDLVAVMEAGRVVETNAASRAGGLR